MSAEASELISQLRGTLGKMEVALSAITEAIVWTDAEGRVQWCNAAFRRFVGKENLELLGDRLMDLLPLEPHGQPLASEAHPVKLLLNAQPVVNACYEFKTSDRRLILELSGSYIKIGEHGSSVVLMVRDVTERRQAEEALRRAHDELEVRVQERTATLEKTVETLQREIAERKRTEQALQQEKDNLAQANRIMMDREGRVLALKQEINELLRALGKETKYRV